MATTKPVTSRIVGIDADDAAYHDYALETKPSTKTTELIVYVAAVVLVAIIALVVGDGDAGGSSADPFSANDAMRYITYLTVGYMIARGLAKSGSRNRGRQPLRRLTSLPLPAPWARQRRRVTALPMETTSSPRRTSCPAQPQGAGRDGSTPHRGPR